MAGAVAGVVRENGFAEIQVIGAGAMNQAIKAIAIARGYLAPMGYDIICVPAFADLVLDDKETTAMRLVVTQR